MKQNLFALAGLIVLAACHPVTTQTKSGGLTIVFQNGSRTIVPSDQVLDAFKAQIDRYSVVLTNQGTGETRSEASPSGGDTVSLGDLEDGTWQIEGTALSSDNLVLARGTATVSVVDGQTASVVVKLSTTQDGTGQFEFRFSVPDNLGVVSVKATLVRDSNETTVTLQRGDRLVVDADKNLLTATLQTVDFNEDGVLSSGTYLLLLDFLGAGGEGLGRHGEAVNIWDDVVSGAWLGPDGELHDARAFDSSDIASSSALPYSINLVDADNNPVPFDLSTFQYTLPATTEITLYGTANVDGQLLEVSINGGTRETVSWDQEKEIALSGVERLAIRVTAQNRQTFLEYVFGKAQSATLKEVNFKPAGLTGDQYGNLYIVDRGDTDVNIGGRIIKIDVAGNETVFAGDGVLEYDDGAPGTASFIAPYGIARDDAGNLYVSEVLSTSDGRIRKISPSGVATTLIDAGSGLASPSGVAVTLDGKTLYVADRYNLRIVSFDLTQSPPPLSVVATGLQYPDAVALSPDEKDLFIGANGDGTVRKVNLDAGNTIETLYSASGGYTYGVAADPEGSVYVCIIAYQLIKKISSGGTITDVVGTQWVGGGTDGVGGNATLNDPWQIYRSPYTGAFYFTERGSQKIRTFQ